MHHWPRSELPLDDGPPGRGHEDDPERPEDVDEGQDGQDAEPEPQEDADLLVDYVDGKHALKFKENY